MAASNEKAPAAAPVPEQASPHGSGNRLARAVWGAAYVLLFRFSPRPLHRWRTMLLRVFGAKMHPTARVYPRLRVWAPWRLTMGAHACIGDDVDCYNVGGVTIGESSTISQYSYLCGATHDFEHPDHPLIPMPIAIGKNVWVAADVFVAPGVTIADGVVVGVRSSVFSDLPAWMVCMGTPARAVKERIMKGGGERREA